MDDFFNKTEYSQNDINLLVENGAEESLYLEFKGRDALGKNEKKKDEIAKDISSFANSDGGIIIYGIDEKTKNVSFIDGEEFTKEWIEQIINSRIQRKIDNLIIYPIRFDEDIKKSVYVIKIPQSYNAPHLSSDKRFYKRSNSVNIPMEEYDIRNTYNRTDKTYLKIEEVEVESGGSMGGGIQYINVDFYVNFQIKNVGNSIENNYKLELHVPKNVYSSTPGIINYIQRNTDKHIIFSFPNSCPIFQDEVTTICKIMIRITKQNYSQLKNDKFIAKLYFSSGKEIREFEITDKLKYQGRILTEDNFRYN
jgi:hypothetical protein